MDPKNPDLEINNELLKTFDPDEEALWLVGGSTTAAVTISGPPWKGDAAVDATF